MNKAEAIHQFWSSFEIPAYDEFSVPKDAEMPYITYSFVADSIGQPIPLTANLWYRESTWTNIDQKVKEIADYIGYGYTSKKIEDGYVWIVRGGAFAQRMDDPSDPLIRRVYLNIIAEFLTA